MDHQILRSLIPACFTKQEQLKDNLGKILDHDLNQYYQFLKGFK